MFNFCSLTLISQARCYKSRFHPLRRQWMKLSPYQENSIKNFIYVWLQLPKKRSDSVIIWRNPKPALLPRHNATCQGKLTLKIDTRTRIFPHLYFTLIILSSQQATRHTVVLNMVYKHVVILLPLFRRITWIGSECCDLFFYPETNCFRFGSWLRHSLMFTLHINISYVMNMSPNFCATEVEKSEHILLSNARRFYLPEKREAPVIKGFIVQVCRSGP